MATLQKRLQTVMRRGNLTVSDLSRWLRVPVPTMRCWVHDGCVPRTNGLDHPLERLEHLVRSRNGFPIPLMTRRDRIAYLARVKKKIGR